MGLLTVGRALDSKETGKASKYVRDHGITQFLNTWRRVKDIHDDLLRFGDEIECGIFIVDKDSKTAKLSIRSAEILACLSDKEARWSHQCEGCTWHPEFGAWMVESTPSRPYSNYASDLLRVERNMILRRRRILSVLHEDEIAPTVTSFPLMGIQGYIHEPASLDSPNSESSFLPDCIINPHPRFAALTRNIRARRGRKVDIKAKLFKDQKTPEYLEFSECESAAEVFPTGYAQEPDTNINMDCMAFGMGMCCLQVTFQARDVDESRYMYDQLAVLAPIMLAMTAATPIFKGRLADIDCRWSIIAQSVDDRTPAERGEISAEELEAARDPHRAGDGICRLLKSRYDSISTYIYHCRGDPDCRATLGMYNDIPCPVDPAIKARLREEGLDEDLAHHVAHLYTRDPLVIFEDLIELNDEESTDHFENIQSTNWQTCRWKPPPPRVHPEDPHIGWRTEFRSMEVQLTDFENAAFTVFIVLITRVLLAFDLALYIPISKVDENMKRAEQRDAVNTQKFFFRRHVAPPEINEANAASGSPTGFKSGGDSSDNLTTLSTDSSDATSASPSKKTGGCCGSSFPAADSFEEMTMDEIFNGKRAYYPGLIPLVYSYLDYINCDPETHKRVSQYLEFISDRASGKLITPATWLRRFVTSHPSYRQDSIVRPDIAHDLLMACKSIGEGATACPELLGNISIDRVRSDDGYGHLLAGKLNSQQRSQLIERLVKRADAVGTDHMSRGRTTSSHASSTAATSNI